MTRRSRLNATLLTTAALIAVAVPSAATGVARHHTTRPGAAAAARRAVVPPARLALGTVKGKIKATHRLRTVDVVLYVRETATDGSKGWVLADKQFANNGNGLALNTKTGAYSFKVKPGTYRLEFNGAYVSGHDWGIVGYGPGKPAAAPFGKSVKVRNGTITKGINVKAAGDFGSLAQPVPGPSVSPSDPTPGGSAAVVLGTWPKGTAWTYTWHIGTSRKYLSFKQSVHVPSTAAGKALNVDIYAYAYGKNGASVSISTPVAK